MQIYEKVKAIREVEGITQVQLAEMTGVSRSTISKLDSGVKKDMKAETLLKICNIPEFQKYTLWLMTGQVNPEAGQISPEIKLAADQLKTGS